MASSFAVARPVILVTLAVTALSAARATGQQAASWRPTVRVQAEVRYDDNPFLLSPDQKDKLQTGSAADAGSGRFRDMPSVTDGIVVAGAEVGLTGTGLLRRTLELSAEATYEANVRNARRRHAELRFGAEQALPKGGRLRFRADWRPDYFQKNYLSDAVDANLDNSIAADERRYEPGTSDEVDLTLSYRHRLVKARRSRPFGLMGELQVGYLTRTYDAPFGGRSRRGPGAGVGLAAELGPRWTVGVDYVYQSLDADTSREVLILDEPEFGQDLNGNASATDLDARAFELVDRSRTEHNLRASAQTVLSRAVELSVAVARRTRSFSSTQPYDVSDRGRRDARNELEGELRVRLARGLRLTLGAVVASQTTNRAGDPGSTGEVADYSRRVVTAGVGYRF